LALSEPDEPDQLRALGERLEQARRGQEGPRRASGGEADQSSRAAMGLGFRIGLELVVAVFVGAAIGWAIDRWLGTKPWGLLAFLFLGIGAGMTNVYRVVRGLGMGVGYKEGGASPPVSGIPDNDWDED
jgi:ATP synthase protein I